MAPKKDDNDETTATPDIDPWQVLDKLADSMAGLKKAVEAGGASSKSDELMATLGSAMARIAETNLAGSKLIAEETRRAHRPSNEISTGISVFNRRGTNLPEDATGVRKPPLKCIVLAPWLVEWESCTREEVELLNLLEAGEYRLRRIDGSSITLTVAVDYAVNGKPSRMVINHDTGFNNDNFRLVPAFADMLRQCLRQSENPLVKQQAAAVLSDDEEEALIEAGELSVSV